MITIDDFRDTLEKAKNKDKASETKIIKMFRPLIVNESTINKIFDPDLFQELQNLTLIVIRTFPIS